MWPAWSRLFHHPVPFRMFSCLPTYSTGAVLSVCAPCVWSCCRIVVVKPCVVRSSLQAACHKWTLSGLGAGPFGVSVCSLGATGHGPLCCCCFFFYALPALLHLRHRAFGVKGLTQALKRTLKRLQPPPMVSRVQSCASVLDCGI